MFKERHLYLLLKLFGDKQPHRYFEQQQLFVIPNVRDIKKYNINVYKLFKYCVENGWIKGVGRFFYKVPLPMRNFVLTDKGDLYFRHMSIVRGGEYRYYKYADREDMKNNNKFEGEKLVIK